MGMASEFSVTQTGLANARLRVERRDGFIDETRGRHQCSLPRRGAVERGHRAVFLHERMLLDGAQKRDAFRDRTLRRFVKQVMRVWRPMTFERRIMTARKR